MNEIEINFSQTKRKETEMENTHSKIQLNDT